MKTSTTKTPKTSTIDANGIDTSRAVWIDTNKIDGSIRWSIRQSGKTLVVSPESYPASHRKTAENNAIKWATAAGLSFIL